MEKSRSEREQISAVMSGRGLTDEQRSDGNTFDSRINEIIDNHPSFYTRLVAATSEAFLQRHPRIGHRVLDLVTRRT